MYFNFQLFSTYILGKVGENETYQSPIVFSNVVAGQEFELFVSFSHYCIPNCDIVSV